LQDVQFVRIGHLVLHALPEKDVEGAPIVGLQVPDDTCIARLQLRRGARRQVENLCVSQLDTIRKLRQRDVGATIVHDEKNVSASHPKVKCFEPFKENNLCHPGSLVVAVNATQIVEIDVLEAAGFLGVSNEPQWKLVRTVTIAAND
jgi:hypothetical protein